MHDIITVTDDEIRAAMRLLATGARLVAEPGGAVAVAACLFRPANCRPLAGEWRSCPAATSTRRCWAAC